MLRGAASRSSAGGRTGPGWKARAAMRRAHHHLDDGRRQTARPRAPSARSSSFERREAARPARGAARRAAREHAAHHRIALLGARHRLDDVAGEGRMQVAEEADGAAVGHAGSSARATVVGLGDALGRHRLRRPRRAPGNSVPSSATWPASSRASTVLGWVPAATRMVRAGSHDSLGRELAGRCIAPVDAERQRRRRGRAVELDRLAASGPRRSGCLPPAPWPLPRGSACSSAQSIRRRR